MLTMKSWNAGLWIGLWGLLLITACAAEPTRITESAPVFKEDLAVPVADPMIEKVETAVASEVILLDARPSFVTAVAPIRQARTLDWRDFTRRIAPQPNALEGDLFFHTRRLARMGIGPDSQVLILGRGVDGDGEEGRLAWTLRYLGVNKVEFKSADQYRPQMQVFASPEVKEAPMWKPELKEELLETHSKWLERIKTRQKFYVLELSTREREIKWPEQMEWGAAQRVKLNFLDFMKMVAANPDGFKSLFASVEALPIVVMDPVGEISGYATALLRDQGLKASCGCQGAAGYFVLPKDLTVKK